MWVKLMCNSGFYNQNHFLKYMLFDQIKCSSGPTLYLVSLPTSVCLSLKKHVRYNVLIVFMLFCKTLLLLR